MNINDSIEEANKQYPSAGSDWFRFEEGDNKMRVMTSFAVMGKHFSQSGYKGICVGEEHNCKGCAEGTKANPRWMAWILDHKDNSLKTVEFPYKIVKQLGEYQNSEEYSFPDFPMPYDINIKAEKAGTKDVIYTIIPARESSVVSQDVQDLLEKEESVENIVQKMKDKQTGEVSDVKKKPKGTVDIRTTDKYPDEDINPEDIPF